MSYSSFKKEKLLFENWRQYLKEEEEKPITSKDVVKGLKNAKTGDKLKLIFKEDIPYPLDPQKTLFTKGKPYIAKVENKREVNIEVNADLVPRATGSKVAIDLQKTMLFPMIKGTFKKAEKEGKKACDLMDCDKSTISRGDEKKRFIEFLRAPDIFDTQAPEPAKPEPAPKPAEPKPAEPKPAPEPPEDKTQILSQLGDRALKLREKFTEIARLQAQLQARSPK